MKPLKFVLLLYAILFFLISNKAHAEENNGSLIMDEISSTYLKGELNNQAYIEVKKGTTLIGNANVNHNSFTIIFDKTIQQTLLTISIKYENGQTTVQNVMYNPPIVNKINDQDRIVSGTTTSYGEITAKAGNTPLTLKSYDTSTNRFEFYPSDALTKDTEVTIILKKDGIKNIIISKVGSAAPEKPVINPVSNKDQYITGSAEANSTVYIKNNKV